MCFLFLLQILYLLFKFDNVFLLGLKAKHHFENFKKRWSKKRTNLRKVSQSGTSTAVVKKAEQDLQPYLFFSWYADFVRPRASKSNVPSDNYSNVDSDSDSDEEDNGHKEEDEFLNEDEDLIDETEKDLQAKKVTPNTEKKQNKKNKKRSSSKPEMNGDEDHEMMKEVVMNMKKRREKRQSEDSDYLFCQNLLADIWQFSQQERYTIKHEINQLIYKCQMNKFSAPPSPMLTPSRPYFGEQNNAILQPRSFVHPGFSQNSSWNDAAYQTRAFQNTGISESSSQNYAACQSRDFTSPGNSQGSSSSEGGNENLSFMSMIKN